MSKKVDGRSAGDTGTKPPRRRSSKPAQRHSQPQSHGKGHKPHGKPAGNKP